MKYKVNENYFKTIDAEEKAYWLGFLYADGCIVERRGKNNNIKSMCLDIALCDKDIVHIKKFLSCIESNHPIREKIIKTENKEYIACSIGLSNTNMCRDLIDKGCVPRKSLILNFPTTDILPYELTKHFIRGYIDGDGCIYVNNNKNGKSLNCKMNIVGTKDLLTAIQKYFLSEKIPVNASFYEKGNAYEMFIHGEDVMIQIYNLLYKDAKIYLDRKKIKFEEMISRIWDKNPNWSGKHGVSFKKSANRWIVSYCPNYKENTQPKNKYFKEFEQARDFRISFEIEQILNNIKTPV